MASSLAELNNAITHAANVIVQTACTQTKDRYFQLSLDNMSESGFSKDDLKWYENFLVAELAERPEFETLEYQDGKLYGKCKREYCPHLKDRWPEEPVLPVSQPLSMTELSEIGRNAISSLQGASLAGLRDMLGMDYMQVQRLALTDQNYYFTVETPEDKPFWTEDVDSALHHMRRRREAGVEARLFYNQVGEDNQIVQIPMAQQSNEQITPVTLPVEERPNQAEYTQAIQKIEGAVYNLPWEYGLSYHISGPRIDDRAPLTLQDALNQFIEAAQFSPNPVLTARLKDPGGGMRSEAVILSRDHGRTHMNTYTVPESSFQPRYGKFYSDLAQLAFPDRVLDIDRWRIRVVAPGERYGRGASKLNRESRPLVEFRDMEGASSLSPDGILVSVCPMDMLIGDEQGRGSILSGQSLGLFDGVESWTLSAGQLVPIQFWLREKEAQLSKENNQRLDRKIQLAQGYANAEQLEKIPQLHNQPER